MYRSFALSSDILISDTIHLALVLTTPFSETDTDALAQLLLVQLLVDAREHRAPFHASHSHIVIRDLARAPL